jgi:hypothetical protein
MSLYNLIIAELPELDNSEEFNREGSISLRDDSDGTGEYIARWDYSKPIPASLTNYDRT